ncbi:alpha/beta fold hydrolase [Streptomyces sp. S1D4-11]
MTGVSRVVDVDGIPVSALLQEARRPRAVVLALHGGAAHSGYFDYPGRPHLSLLRTGSALGFTVLALDRPGYGSSAPHGGELAPVERRVDLAYAAVDRLLASRPRGAGVFVLAHSIGCELALRMAADERGSDLLGVEIAAPDATTTTTRWASWVCGTTSRGGGPRAAACGTCCGIPRTSTRTMSSAAPGSPRPRPPTRESWPGVGRWSFPNSPRGCASPCTTASASTSGCGGPGPRRWPTSRPCSPPRHASSSTSRRTAATT